MHEAVAARFDICLKGLVKNHVCDTEVCQLDHGLSGFLHGTKPAYVNKVCLGQFLGNCDCGRNAWHMPPVLFTMYKWYVQKKLPANMQEELTSVLVRDFQTFKCMGELASAPASGCATPPNLEQEDPAQVQDYNQWGEALVVPPFSSHMCGSCDQVACQCPAD